MPPINRFIIDTDPGVDDVMALLLALSATPEEIEIVMISVTYGNVPRLSCLRNVVALFHVLEKELDWRKANGKVENYETMKAFKPIVAIGPEHPLESEALEADDFHGADGLHNVHDTHPHLTPAETWKSMWHTEANVDHEPSPYSKYFTPSKELSHKEILRILKENPKDTITVVAVGPLTTVALAAAEDPETFLRAKELVVMGGAVGIEGNITPVAEFNHFADTIAAARVFALTSPNPQSTMPPESENSLGPYPAKLSRKLKLTLFPLDITTPHLLGRKFFTDAIEPSLAAGSPLSQWVNHFMSKTFDKIIDMEGDAQEPGLSLHDPITIWYMLTSTNPAWKPVAKLEDIRVETQGQWTRGMNIVDRRLRRTEEASLEVDEAGNTVDVLTMNDVPGDTFGWLSASKGNRINRMVTSPGDKDFAGYLMKRIFG